MVSPNGGIWRKLIWVHNYKHSPIQWCQNCFCTPVLARRNCAHTHSNIQKCDGQTNRQTRNCKHSRVAETRLTGNMQKVYLGRIWHATVGSAVVYAYTLNLIWITVLCRPCRAKKPLKYRNIDQIFTFYESSCAHLPLPIRNKFGKR